MIGKVLLVCTGNTCRSSMAEALFKDLVEKDDNLRSSRISIESAGIPAASGCKASVNAIAALRERGIDLSGHRARRITGGMVADSDIILTMTQSQKESLLREFEDAAGKTYTLKEYAYSDDKKDGNNGGIDIRDPFGALLEDYRRCLSEIEEALKASLDRIKREL